MKTIVLLDDIFFEKLGDDYILQSKHSERYCLINSDAHSMISMLPQMTDTENSIVLISISGIPSLQTDLF